MLYYDDFKVYSPDQFTQYETSGGKNCGPTFVANVLSYYKRLGFDRLYDGEITQQMYDEICELIGFDDNSNGTLPYKLIDGISAFAERAGYKANSKFYLFDLWSDLKESIKLGYPVSIECDCHVYMGVAYEEYTDGRKMVLVVTNQAGIDYEWRDFDTQLEKRQMHSFYISNQ